MGFLSSKAVPTMKALPSGSFSVDRTGRIVSSTVPQRVPTAHIEQIATTVLQTFRGAEHAGLPLSEFTAYFGSFKIAARELKGGAFVFLSTTGLDK